MAANNEVGVEDVTETNGTTGDGNRGDALIINCLPLTDAERRAFAAAAPGVRQEFVGNPIERGTMIWKAHVPAELKAKATAVIGNIPPSDCRDYPRLAWLQTWSAGVDKYVAPGVLADGVTVTNATGAYGQTVGEHLFAMMWALMRNLPDYARQQGERRWHDLGRALSPAGATVLVIGTGDIGSHFARLVKAVGAHTVGIRRDAAKPADGIDEMHGFDELDALLPEADVVALAVPASPDTTHLIDARRFSLLKSTAVLLNAGRGNAIDPIALERALAEDQLHGVGLDVTEPEPLPADSPLWDEPHCLITPHVAGGNHLEATERRIIDIALENVRRYAAGEPFVNVRR
ncbi:D-2-hydroxyacid dehydrogenase [Bifidobacterium platyrrhinorum]|uniref:D-2-hydroxyacid dehydrogenase n=1 Tax=Bifidobacterium platyrrhinorum TaxID=2661628 RepID=A0A6L9SSM5_9BIFI|nr:D-2-hydroxyacid dehydrogenase [Bifidobacterium platyrrhinorum]NEG54191.1 D-2-hydroxyacid dehydrogenase [Bifidobacterium platyrrhinorum]